MPEQQQIKHHGFETVQKEQYDILQTLGIRGETITGRVFLTGMQVAAHMVPSGAGEGFVRGSFCFVILLKASADTDAI